MVNDIWGAAPCANAATSTDFGPEVASCNCNLYERLVKYVISPFSLLSAHV